MITNSREKGLQAKLEGENNNIIESKLIFKASTPSSSSSTTARQWGGFRNNPRIVRVSRSLGGKDRHSKVCTIRGLRDRRIRLSVPTAIQLYDLQDRLGLSQPSKVIDWLLDATKDDIDKLPPLQIPQGLFGHHQQILLPPPHHVSNPPPHDLQPSLASFFDANPTNFMKDAAEEHHQTLWSNTKTKCWDIDAAALKAKGKELIFERGTHNINVSDHGHQQKSDSIIRINEAENQDGIGIGTGFGGQQLFGQKLFPMSSTHSSLPPAGMLNNSMAYNYYHSEPSNLLSLSQFGSHGFASQIDSHTGPSQLFFCPPTPPPPPPLFSPYPTPYITSTSSPVLESDIPRQINHTQLLSTSTSSTSHHLLPNSLMPSLHSSSLPFKPFQTISNPKQLHSHNNDESLQKKGHSTTGS